MLNDDTKANLTQLKWMFICILVVGFIIQSCIKANANDDLIHLAMNITPAKEYTVYLSYQDGDLQNVSIVTSNAEGSLSTILEPNKDYTITVYLTQEDFKIHTIASEDYTINTKVESVYLTNVFK